MSLLRLDKIISDSGIATRSEARKLISAGRVLVNGKTETSSDLKVDISNAEICFDGQLLNNKKYRYFMLNKPMGVLSATEDREQKTVLDLLSSDLNYLNLFPVGRLDKDTTGLIILTNDGEFSHSVTSPKRHVDKSYEFTVEGNLTADDSAEFVRGVNLRDGTKCLPAVLEIDAENTSHGIVTVSEGKYHQVKRMLASRGTPVLTLKRISIGGLLLDTKLNSGEYRELDEVEIKLIFNKRVT